DGYIKGYKGCKITCVINDDYCDTECKAEGGTYGYCWKWGLACWCEDLPDEKRWKSETNTC
uniref:Beta-toxin BotIT2 n=1 Tax=Buthus occitanus tunetanus TaxID=6871 RepID=SIX2_BUTOC|nr:RecName: Full=Beta-toxin BotIT2; Short=Bot IT2; AltName: Full=Insect toxin 2 [Buthus occitanus tunetanus]